MLSLSKARGVITENISLLRHLKYAVTAELNEEDTLMLPTILRLLTATNRGYNKCCLLLSVGTLHWSEEFY